MVDSSVTSLISDRYSAVEDEARVQNQKKVKKKVAGLAFFVEFRANGRFFRYLDICVTLHRKCQSQIRDLATLAVNFIAKRVEKACIIIA